MEIIRESELVFEIRSKVPLGRRLILSLFSLIPLLVPYQLLLKRSSSSYSTPVLFAVVIISLVALAASIFLIWTVVGMKITLRFDQSKGLFTHSEGAATIGWRENITRLENVAKITIADDYIGDRIPSYGAAVVLHDGHTFQTGTSSTKEEAEEIVRQANLLLEEIRSK
jgi:hypothetical protein